MKRKYAYLTVAVLALFSCSRMPVLAPVDDVKLGIPQNLSSKFAVVDTNPPVPTATTEQPTTKKKAVEPAKASAKSKKTSNAKVWKNRWVIPQPYHPGDRSLYEITYFGTIAGTFELKVLPYKRISEREVFHFQGIARSSSIFSLFYRLNDMAESFLDRESLLSHKFTIKLDESWQQRELVEFYDREKNLLYYWNKVEHKKKGNSQDEFTKEILPDAVDVMSAVFYLRTLPLEVGKIYPLNIISNGKPYHIDINVLRKETLATKAGEFPAIVVQPIAKMDGILQNSGDVYFWISDDAHRSLLKIDAKVKIGSVIAYLKELEYGKPATTP